MFSIAISYPLCFLQSGLSLLLCLVCYAMIYSRRHHPPLCGDSALLLTIRTTLSKQFDSYSSYSNCESSHFIPVGVIYPGYCRPQVMAQKTLAMIGSLQRQIAGEPYTLYQEMSPPLQAEEEGP
jgi:hypothetical protein